MRRVGIKPVPEPRVLREVITAAEIGFLHLMSFSQD
jgi:hypothetical protein